MPSRQDWLLLALAHRAGEPMTPVQIQKAMFLLRMEAAKYVGRDFYEFAPYNYGPFNAEIYHDLQRLGAEGLVSRDSSGGRSWKSYTATPAGMRAAIRIGRSVDPKAAKFLARAVDWVTSLSFPQLVRAIYSKYPKFKVNSVFTG